MSRRWKIVAGLPTHLKVVVALLPFVLLTACGASGTATSAPVVGEAQSTDTSAAADCPTHTPYPTYTPLPTAAPAHTPTPVPTVAPSATATVASTSVASGMPSAAPTSSPPQSVPAGETTATDASTLGITRLEETSPGPPFTVQVDAVRIEDGKYRVMGMVRNDGTETYEGVGIHATFYTLGPSGQGSDEDGLYPHGPVDAYCPCPFLEPDAECPFNIEIYERNYAAYGLHPYGQPVAFYRWHEQGPLVLSNLNVSNDSVGNVRITGAVVNENAFAVKSATIAAALTDADGKVVSVGSTTVPKEIESGAEVPFDLRIAYQPYTRYELYVQGVRH